MTDTKRWSLDPSAVTPTVLPLRSAMLRMPSFPNNSKQPTCTPASTVTAPPASITRHPLRGEVHIEITLPLATASLISALDAPSTYRISVKPSARSRSSTTNCGSVADRGLPHKTHRGRFRAAPSRPEFVGVWRSPAAPASERVVRKRRRVCIIAIGSLRSVSCSRLQLALEFVEEAPIGVFGEDLVRVRFDQTRFVKAQGIKPDRVLGVVVPPL